ncbi:hypothetical protein [Cellulomonas bogoriensis]|uniref:Uncharacterized protein n=1 Tax=Cellulomonas bogoriensis 69B4 = DSM 16987 TaxID=1386082 RepID=A0A0A0C2N2_9CELL|nr:hypothetical protein [Cellulomonas bogoriensis]KGM14446.1 hypothetical protein N869_11045 [Cellulomonas bogoriensis 69B4 = DSM 16987]
MCGPLAAAQLERGVVGRSGRHEDDVDLVLGARGLAHRQEPVHHPTADLVEPSGAHPEGRHGNQPARTPAAGGHLGGVARGDVGDVDEPDRRDRGEAGRFGCSPVPALRPALGAEGSPGGPGRSIDLAEHGLPRVGHDERPVGGEHDDVVVEVFESCVDDEHVARCGHEFLQRMRRRGARSER